MDFNSGNNKVGKYFTWGALVFSAIFLADLTASGLERKLQQQPQELAVASVAQEQAGNEQIGGLEGILRQPEVEETATAASNSSTSEDNSKEQEEDVGTELEGITLLGTMLSGGYRAAVIEKNGESAVIPEGQELDGYLLAHVDHTWAYFTHPKKKPVRLTLETAVDPEGIEIGMEQPKAATEKKDKKKDKEKEKSEESIVKEKLSLDDIRAILNDTSSIAQKVRVVPQSKDGEPYGTKLVFRQPDNVMAQLGLENDDVLLSVNGSPCRSVEDMYQGCMTIRNAENLEFVVDRNGEQKTIRYELAH